MTAFPAPRPALEASPLDPMVARMARGDQSALAELYDATAGLLHATCVRILRDPAAAEESWVAGEE